MILGFKNKFIGSIQDGTKFHTIRQDYNDRWKPGNTIHFSSGVRTKAMQIFKVGKCITIQKILIQVQPDGYSDCIIDGVKMSLIEKHILAANDGFDNFEQLLTFFFPKIKPPFLDKNKNEKFIFSGKIIHWTNYKY